MSGHTPIPDTSAPWDAGGTPAVDDDALDPTPVIDLTDLPPVVNTHPEG